MSPPHAQPIVVAVDRSISDSVIEAKYVLQTLLHTAGFATHFVWADDDRSADLYYGPRTDSAARVQIPSIGWRFDSAPDRAPAAVVTALALPFFTFPGEVRRAGLSDATSLRFPSDIVFASYWLLTGAAEPSYPRSRFDDLDLDASLFVREQLGSQPLVSLYAARLRAFLDPNGTLAVPWEWEGRDARFAFALTHDVDYPEIIRPIEVARVLAARKVKGLGLAGRVARGDSHFWIFREWMDVAQRAGTRSCFYFMARQGSLLQYAMGTPDDFYDVRTPRFQRLFDELRESGCEIGLHASYHAHRSSAQLKHEVQRIADAARVECSGNRHHYWHLDPDNPNETLRRHGEAGLRYDSSLGLEYYPGYRRAICHPFRVFHPGTRRQLPTVQLPPAWMDDHFDRRRAKNGITDPDAAARALLEAARATRGIVVVDYHSRGLNTDFYPHYGPWLARFLDSHVDASMAGRTPNELLDGFLAREAQLIAASHDDTAETAPLTVSTAPADFVIAPMRHDDIPEVATLHHALFGDPKVNGHSIATLGPEFLARAFYALNLDNPGIRCLVARHEGRVVAFSVYAIDKDSVFSHLISKHPVRLGVASALTLLRNPSTLGAFWSNARYMGGERLPFLDGVKGWWIVAGVYPEARDPAFEKRIGGRVAAQLFDRMESHMRAVGCPAWYGVVRPDNPPINIFLQRRGAKEVGTAPAQGLEMRYYVRRYGDDG